MDHTRRAELVPEPAAPAEQLGLLVGDTTEDGRLHRCWGLIDPMVGFSGTKLSGYGSKGTAAHLDGYLYTKSVSIQLEEGAGASERRWVTGSLV